MQDERITRLIARKSASAVALRRIIDAAEAEHRDLSDDEDRESKRLAGELREYDERIAELSDEADSFPTGSAAIVRGGRRGADDDWHPLAFDARTVNAVGTAISTRATDRFNADGYGVEERAALVTGTFGAARVWTSNPLDGPRLLHRSAGVGQRRIDAPFAQHPVLTLPASTAGVGETVTTIEYASSTAGSVTMTRFGRWTDLSEESLLGADARPIIAMHQIGIAKDLDTVLINAVETAAGAAVGFTADVPSAIRKAMAQVIDNTAAADSGQLVVLVHPDNASLLQDVSPIGGQTIAEGFQRFSGALVYPSSAVDTGLMTVANLQAGTQYLEARQLQTETQVASIKTEVVTVGTSIICGYAVSLVTGFAVKVDVVTP